MRKFYNFLNIINQNPTTKYALATIIHVKGSAYRHEGAKMLFCENGERYGTISAGCLEEDLSNHAIETIQNQTSKIVTYDLSSEDDLTWGQSAGCNGAVTIYIEYVQSHSNSVWKEIEQQLENGDSLVCLKTMDSTSNIIMGFNLISGQIIGIPVAANLKSYLIDAMDSMNGELSIFNSPNFGEIMVERLEPKDQLYIFGAGPDVEPVVRFASQLDFNIHVIDPRSAYCNENNFPNAHSLVIEHPETYIKQNKISQNSYVLIMTHNFNWDCKILDYFINNPPYYLGILGPKKRTKRLLSSEHVPSWISSPVGVPINAEGAEEISISIAAELVQMKNTKQANMNIRKKLLV
jgi:xanthine dehydrogenase accessory factor